MSDADSSSPSGLQGSGLQGSGLQGSGPETSGMTDHQKKVSRREHLNPGTRPMSSRASKAFVIGAFLFIFGLGTVGSILLVDVAETALDQSPVAPDSVENVAPTPGEGDVERIEDEAGSASDSVN